ncbi:DNA polymerase III subunit epsilon [Corynebacterium hansenii]|uniref:DNA polymerase III subunit epsilon n=1 Tax=Corynebacterium hansenii TaxID=394964 RepID=A0ABV7ZNK6_9CORY|nr:DNA polymerase III subunit epsilon [Corynebacterium hansenii]WJY98826.1 DNA polymerase III subunit epsilon [Corynebacterium hansenii]
MDRSPSGEAGAPLDDDRVAGAPPATADSASSVEGGADSACPYVAAVVKSTGIHPKSARMVSLGLAEFSADGEIGRTWHGVFTIGEDPGPVHLHGLEPDDLEGAPRFGTVLGTVGEFLDGRELVTHDLPRTWGFIVEEAKRARRHANRANRGRRGRGRGRVRAGRIPAPAAVTDTLVTARRQSVELPDTRLRGVARAYGLDAPSPVASVENIGVPERERTMGDVELLVELWRAQRERGGFATWPTEELRADHVGLQRSSVRVDAMEAPRPTANPGKYRPGGKLKAGMEFAIAPELASPADDIIGAGVAAGLAYSEKVTRETSVLVCNRPADVTPEELVGKAMHAHRKEIPLVSDTAFLRLLDEM